MRFTHAALGLRPFTMQDRSQAAMLQRSLQTEGGRPTFSTDFLSSTFGPSFAPAVKATNQAEAASTDEAHVEPFTLPWQDGFARLPGLCWCSSYFHRVASTSATAAPLSHPIDDVEVWIEDAADEQQQVPAAGADAQDAADQQQHVPEDMADQQPPSDSSAGALRFKLQFEFALQSPTMMGSASNDGASSCTGSVLHSLYNSSDEEAAGSCDDSTDSAAYQRKLAAELHTGSRSRGVALPTGKEVFPSHPLSGLPTGKEVFPSHPLSGLPTGKEVFPSHPLCDLA